MSRHMTIRWLARAGAASALVAAAGCTNDPSGYGNTGYFPYYQNFAPGYNTGPGYYDGYVGGVPLPPGYAVPNRPPPVGFRGSPPAGVLPGNPPYLGAPPRPTAPQPGAPSPSTQLVPG